jgi:hypothetical protein
MFARLQGTAGGIRNDQRPRGDAHDPQAAICSAGYLKLLRRGRNPRDSTPTRAWRRGGPIDEFVDALGKQKLQVILTIWPEPTQRYIKSLYAGKGNLVNFVKKHKKYVYGVELEDEDNWAEAFTGEGESLETAAGELISKLREKLPGIEIGVTSTSRGFRHSMLRKDSLLNHEDVHFISFQTYQPYHAVYQKHRCVKADNLDDYAPGQFQKKVIIQSSWLA